jgi:gentisate 1,2-dioxygenase
MANTHLNQEKLLENASYYEYTTSADPIGAGLIKEVPYHVFPHTLHEEGPTQIIPLDLSKELGCSYPATSPALLANFVHIKSNEKIQTAVNATSQLFYVIRGNGRTEVNDLIIPWNTGDFFVLPSNSTAIHSADSDSAFYYVHDEPLLNYLGAEASMPRFEPTLFTQEASYIELQKAIDSNNNGQQRNRLSVLLANKNFPQTRTITHVLWAMFGVLQADQVQPPHRHQSVAIDFAIECQPGCYTLIGKELDEQGNIIDAVRADWKPFSVFVTPPGYWHSHHNESGVQAHVIPMQDAGLHTYLRTLDIQFAHPVSPESHKIG